jgi:hypothetical protein
LSLLANPAGEAMKIEGLEQLQKVLRRLEQFQDGYRKISLMAGELVRNELATYPGPPRYPLRWASRKQAFYVKFVLGNIPYKRGGMGSQRLGASWTVEPQDKIKAVVGTRVTYAPWVQSAERQQPFHKDTGWITDAEAVNRVKESDLEAIAKKTFQRMME